MDRKQNAKRILFWSILILAVALMYFVAEKLFDKKIAFICDGTDTRPVPLHTRGWRWRKHTTRTLNHKSIKTLEKKK